MGWFEDYIAGAYAMPEVGDTFTFNVSKPKTTTGRFSTDRPSMYEPETAIHLWHNTEADLMGKIVDGHDVVYAQPNSYHWVD